MLVMAFLQWWYGAGWRDAGRRMLAHIQQTYLGFSVPILLRTMFQPWRRIITPPGSSLGQHARAMLDNLVSRAVGFTVRLLALISAVALILVTSLVGALIMLIWPIAPLLAPACIVWAIL